MTLEKKELKLIYELDSNYRKPYSKIGKKIRMSEQLISHKVKSFVRKGIIEGYCPIMDYSRFGLLTFVVCFKVHYRSEQSFNKLINQLKEDDDITAIMECDGKYDLIVIFAAKNPSSFNKKLKKIVSENPELRGQTILTAVVEHYYLRDYLVGKDGEEDTIIGGDRDEIPVDTTNKKILTAIIEGKKKVVEIAKASDTTPKTALSRLKWLEKKEIIKGYRLLLNSNLMGVSASIFLVKYRNITFEQEDEFRYFCKYNPHIIELIKTFGEWDAILNIETKDPAEFRKLLLQIKEKFDDIIEDADNFRIFAVNKKQFLPLESLR